MKLDRNDRILITGITGMVGSAAYKKLKNSGFKNILSPNRSELNLLDKKKVDAYFEKHKPQHVLMIAAKVGGIKANRDDPVSFLKDNIIIQTNLFEACYKYKTKKNLFLGSSCVYPTECKQPMKEEYLLSGKLEPTNEGYGLAKIAGLKLAKYYYEQYGMLTISPMVCNIYGTNDHYDLDRAHVLSALVRRFVEAKKQNLSTITLWGTGQAKREFIHVEDVADAILFLMDNYDSPEIINIGTGYDITIFELAKLIAKNTDYKGKIVWDSTQPDGMQRRCVDIEKLKSMQFQHKIDLELGIKKTIQEYKNLTNNK